MKKHDPFDIPWDAPRAKDLSPLDDLSDDDEPGHPPPFGQKLSQDYDEQKERSRQRRVGENGEVGEIASFLPVKWAEVSPSSPNSPGSICQETFFPLDSILADYHEYTVTQTEAPDTYIMGSILSVTGAILARNVWVEWAAYDGKLYPSVYSILAGPPGNMKSTSIYPAKSIAKGVLDEKAFLTQNYSPEALFDSFYKHPDRFLVCSDAGSTITKWANPYDGQRLSHTFLTLFDCEPMSEGFRRNRNQDDLDTQERVTGPLSLSILFGATLSKCQFNGNSERDGLSRRFLHHLAIESVREIDRPKPDHEWIDELVEKFRRLTYLKGAFQWEPDAAKRFDQYKKEIRARKKAHDPFDEATQGRLATLCVYVLKILMQFECAIICKRDDWIPDSPRLVFHLGTLELAIAYVEECFKAAQSLNDVANKNVIREQAETLLANIRSDFQFHPDDSGSIIVTRTQITKTYAPHPGRRSGLTINDLYVRIIPCLIASGEALLLPREDRKEIYAFRAE
jgi:hypothetical protein